MIFRESRVGNRPSPKRDSGRDTEKCELIAFAGNPVYLNVYILGYGAPGLRAYHTGIACGRREYSFYEGAGIFHCHPEHAPAGVYFKSIHIGEVDNPYQVNDAAYKLSNEFPKGSYNIISHNCNDYTSRLSEEVFGKKNPSWINRLARIARSGACSILIPLFVDKEQRLRLSGEPRMPPERNSAPPTLCDTTVKSASESAPLPSASAPLSSPAKATIKASAATSIVAVAA